ncbi:MAG: hypothetical protein M0Q43_10340 [Methanothrix sp.]|jgi:hypothetical protein|nr:hypothetical protein [Methanothrix sp.]
MTNAAVFEAKKEAKRFLKRMDEWDAKDLDALSCRPFKERAALVRASLDLTMALAKMRQS